MSRYLSAVRRSPLAFVGLPWTDKMRQIHLLSVTFEASALRDLRPLPLHLEHFFPDIFLDSLPCKDQISTERATEKKMNASGWESQLGFHLTACIKCQSENEAVFGFHLCPGFS